MGERTAEDRKVEGSTPSRGIFMFEKTILARLSKADSFSLLNAIFGTTSICLLFSNEWYAFVFIMLAVLADGMDGTIARKYGSNLPIIDEFADMISFVAAPSAILFNHYGLLIIPFIYAYIFASIVHLLNYHYGTKEIFVGLPTPAAAIVVASICILSFPVWAAILIVSMLSILIFLPIKYKRMEGLERIIALVIIIVAIFLGSHHIFIFILLASTFIYIALSPFTAR